MHHTLNRLSISNSLSELAYPAYDMSGPVIYGEQVLPSERGNHSLPIYTHEILFASKRASTEFRKDKKCNGKHVVTKNPKKLEFRECFTLYSLSPSFVDNSHVYLCLSLI